jgi:hypothetical protein
MFLTPSSSRARQVVVVDHVMPLLRAEQDRDHLMPEKLAAVPLGTFAPVLSLLLDLAHPDRDLGRAQLREGAGSRRAARRRCLWKGQGPGQKPASILGQPDWGRRLRRLVSLRLGAGPAPRTLTDAAATTVAARQSRAIGDWSNGGTARRVSGRSR